MTVLGSKDLLKVKFSGLAADYDRDTVVNPFIPSTFPVIEKVFEI